MSVILEEQESSKLEIEDMNQISTRKKSKKSNSRNNFADFMDKLNTGQSNNKLKTKNDDDEEDTFVKI